MLSQFIQEHTNDDVKKLALQRNLYPDIDMNNAVRQIAGRQMARKKLPSFFESVEIRYPMHISLEQCSSEQTALYKTELVTGNTLVDLTGGFGVDTLFLSSRFSKATYVERQPELCEIVRHNASVLGIKNISFHTSEAVDFLTKMEPVDVIFIDPARRSEKGTKVVRIQDCEPDLLKIKDQLPEKSKQVLIKLSPMLDISQALALLPETSEVHVVSIHNECKELLLLMNHNTNKELTFHCINLLPSGRRQTFSFTGLEEKNAAVLYADAVTSGNYLYEPNASVLKAGAYSVVSEKIGVKKIHRHTHLYVSDSLLSEFPGRIFQVDEIIPFAKKELKAVSSLQKANISVRNFPLSVDEIRKKTGIKEGGDVYLFATTLGDSRKVLLKTHQINRQ